MLRNYWVPLCQELRIKGDSDFVFYQIQACNNDRRRYYNNLNLLERRIEAFSSLQHYFKHRADQGVVELAIWLQNLIYNPGLSTGSLTADMVRVLLRYMKYPEFLTARVTRLIIESQRIVPPNTTAARVLADVLRHDLGRPPQDFDYYFRAMYQEYTAFGCANRWPKQVNRFQRLLERPNIYSIPLFHERYETQARENLDRAIRMSERFKS